MLVVVRTPGESVEPEELRDFLTERLPDFALPSYVRFVPTLPKNPSERVLKGELRQEGITDDTWPSDGGRSRNTKPV
jgi:crotonobetaine/carnitine-CoA ligase